MLKTVTLLVTLFLMLSACSKKQNSEMATREMQRNSPVKLNGPGAVEISQAMIADWSSSPHTQFYESQKKSRSKYQSSEGHAQDLTPISATMPAMAISGSFGNMWIKIFPVFS